MTRNVPRRSDPSLRLYTGLRYALSEVDLYLVHLNLDHHSTYKWCALEKPRPRRCSATTTVVAKRGPSRHEGEEPKEGHGANVGLRHTSFEKKSNRLVGLNVIYETNCHVIQNQRGTKNEPVT
jgi:hypothetical protein